MILRRLSQNVPRVSCGADLFQSRHREHRGGTEKSRLRHHGRLRRIDAGDADLL